MKWSEAIDRWIFNNKKLILGTKYKFSLDELNSVFQIDCSLNAFVFHLHKMGIKKEHVKPVGYFNGKKVKAAEGVWLALKDVYPADERFSSLTGFNALDPDAPNKLSSEVRTLAGLARCHEIFKSVPRSVKDANITETDPKKRDKIIKEIKNHQATYEWHTKAYRNCIRRWWRYHEILSKNPFKDKKTRLLMLKGAPACTDVEAHKKWVWESMLIA